jgi:hypothetical protein
MPDAVERVVAPLAFDEATFARSAVAFENPDFEKVFELLGANRAGHAGRLRFLRSKEF